MPKTHDQRRLLSAAVRWWQGDDRVAPLRCARDTKHRLLKLDDDGTRVALRCPDCGDESLVPQYVIGIYKAALNARQW